MLLSALLKSPRAALKGAGLGLALGAALGFSGLSAAPLDVTADLRGAPISQQFLPSGAAIVTTEAARACVVSSRIVIEASTYRASDGTDVPFDQIRRSIAASVQAVQAHVAGQTTPPPPGFRIQLKFSPAPGSPILLTLAGQDRDVQDRLEPSTDSLWIDGDLAGALQAAFAAGERPLLQSTSAETAHLVTDRLEAPDLAALTACSAVLAGPPPATVLPLSNEIRVSFVADPATTPLATLPDLRTCGMTDPPGVLHLARLDSVTGFFAQTDKVFVSFDADGSLARVYIPGILDGDFSNGGHQARLSRAADSNLPMARNDVKGCLGAGSVPVCHYATPGGGHLLGACIGTDGPDGGLVPQTIASNDPGATPLRPGDSTSGGSTPGGFTPGGGTPPGDTTIDGELPDGEDGDPDDPSPVPVPAPLLLLAGALLGLFRLKARRR